MFPCRILSMIVLATLVIACGGKDKDLVDGENAPWRATPPAGAVILAGSIDAADGLAAAAFAERLAGGSAALVPTDSISPADPLREAASILEKSAGRSDFVKAVDVPYTNCARTESRENGDILYGAAGVWFYSGLAGSAQLLPCLVREDGTPTEVWEQTLELSARGGVIAGSGAGAEMLGAVVLDAKRKDYTPPAETRWKAREGLGLLNDWIILVMNDPMSDQEWLAPQLGLNPDAKALAISPDGAVLVEEGGQKLTLLGGKAAVMHLNDNPSALAAVVIEPLM
ncbi:hypothetical protein KQI84_09700 [bacterium]|nr:hypothetical protein [bacterium]